MFRNPGSAAIESLLRSARTIAVVGLSDNPARPSFGVAASLQRFGYRAIPVTPTAAPVLGERTVPDPLHLPDVPADYFEGCRWLHICGSSLSAGARMRDGCYRAT